MLTVADEGEKGAHDKKYPLLPLRVSDEFCFPTLKTPYFWYTTLAISELCRELGRVSNSN